MAGPKMTEGEWLNASEPQAMLEFLRTSGRTSERKLRLFAVACSRRVWTLIDALGRSAVEVAEKFADGLAGPDELRAARLACQGAGDQASWYAAATIPENAARNAARSAQVGVANNPLVGTEAAELLAQANLVRDIFGDPFRPLSVDQSWQTPAVVELAQVIYDDRAFELLPELADALEQTGCSDAEVLGHCQAPEPHVRGCWLIDLVLGKE
jgi:hypothetical protein